MSGDEELSPAARVRLLAVAREALAAHFQGSSRPPRDEEDPVLNLPRGAFVTLKRRADHALRGCIGYVRPDRPLAETVAEAAVAAASQDPRFPPVTREELAGIEVEVSALSATRPIRPEEVQVGVHGLIVRAEGRSGLLLPQVPLAHGWTRDDFLAHTCLKAGLPRTAWRDPSCELVAFTAVVIRED
jgi:AmmeMemoRadiSam system protein A